MLHSSCRRYRLLFLMMYDCHIIVYNLQYFIVLASETVNNDMLIKHHKLRHHIMFLLNYFDIVRFYIGSLYMSIFYEIFRNALALQGTLLRRD